MKKVRISAFLLALLMCVSCLVGCSEPLYTRPKNPSPTPTEGSLSSTVQEKQDYIFNSIGFADEYDLEAYLEGIYWLGDVPITVFPIYPEGKTWKDFSSDRIDEWEYMEELFPRELIKAGCIPFRGLFGYGWDNDMIIVNLDAGKDPADYTPCSFQLKYIKYIDYYKGDSAMTITVERLKDASIGFAEYMLLSEWKNEFKRAAKYTGAEVHTGYLLRESCGQAVGYRVENGNIRRVDMVINGCVIHMYADGKDEYERVLYDAWPCRDLVSADDAVFDAAVARIVETVAKYSSVSVE